MAILSCVFKESGSLNFSCKVKVPVGRGIWKPQGGGQITVTLKGLFSARRVFLSCRSTLVSYYLRTVGILAPQQ